MKTVWRSARLVSAASEEPRAGFLDALGDGKPLLLGFDGARAGDERDVLAADDDVAGGRGNSEDAVFFFGVAADEFIGLADRDALADAGHGFKNAEIDGAFVAGDTDGGADRAGDGMRFEAQALDALADGADLFLGCVGLHDDKHGWFPRRGAWTLSLRHARAAPPIGE